MIASIKLCCFWNKLCMFCHFLECLSFDPVSVLRSGLINRNKKRQKNCYKRKNKQAKTNKQYTGTEDLLKIFAILIGEHVALISENAAFSFKSHRHGSVFRCFPDSLFFWRLSGNNHLTSATNWRLKITRLMPGKKSINIEGVLRLRLGHPETVLLLSRRYDHLLKITR